MDLSSLWPPTDSTVDMPIVRQMCWIHSTDGDTIQQ